MCNKTLYSGRYNLSERQKPRESNAEFFERTDKQQIAATDEDEFCDHCYGWSCICPATHPVLCDKCGAVDMSGTTPRTASAECDPHDWQPLHIPPPTPPEPDGLIAEAREFFARHEDYEFYRAVAYSGYKHATEKQAEVLASFARQAIAADRLKRAEAPADLIAAAKEWLETNTPLRWSTEPDPECPDEPLEALNRRPQKWADRLATFGQKQRIEAVDEFKNGDGFKVVRRLTNEIATLKAENERLAGRVKELEDDLGAMVLAFRDRGDEPEDITEGTRDAAMKVASQDLSENPEWAWIATASALTRSTAMAEYLQEKK